MSCSNNQCYLPEPTREWSRVQNRCYNQVDIDLQMINKGNVLQYKKNSANLTKSQKYSLMAKGKWINRNTTWATQSARGYTNPNSQSLKRVNSINITTDGSESVLPVTCPYPNIIINPVLPSNGSGTNSNPQTLPPPPPNPSNNPNEVIPLVNVPEVDDPIIIQDFGTLICSTQENICTGEIIEYNKSNQNCNPTTDSNVPGTIMDLCWDGRMQTWYPRQRYTMNTSDNKWPVNAVLLSAIKPIPPVITSVTNDGYIITLTWTQDESCLPVSRFTIYQNGVPIEIVDGSIRTTTTVGVDCLNEYYITGSNVNVVSDPSNTVQVNLTFSYTATGDYQEFTNNEYAGVIFTVPSTNVLQSIKFTCDKPNVSILAIGGGGGGGLEDSSNLYPGGGGGGAGYYYVNNYKFIANNPINITVGSGGNGAPYSGTNVGSDGTDTIVDDSLNQITSIGGYGSSGANGSIFGSGGYANNGVFVPNSNLNGNIGCGGGGASGDYDFFIPDGNDSTLTSIQLPFIAGNPNVYISGGAGAAVKTFETYPNGQTYSNDAGGGAGHGFAGVGGASSTTHGESAITGIDGSNYYYGGGGGGGFGTVSSGDTAGNGADGAVMIWWSKND